MQQFKTTKAIQFSTVQGQGRRTLTLDKGVILTQVREYRTGTQDMVDFELMPGVCVTLTARDIQNSNVLRPLTTPSTNHNEDVH